MYIILLYNCVSLLILQLQLLFGRASINGTFATMFTNLPLYRFIIASTCLASKHKKSNKNFRLNTRVTCHNVKMLTIFNIHWIWYSRYLQKSCPLCAHGIQFCAETFWNRAVHVGMTWKALNRQYIWHAKHATCCNENNHCIWRN